MALLFKPICRAFSPPPKPTSKSSLMAARASFSKVQSHRKLPILLFDVMDTLVRDPFYQDIPAFFRMPMKELLETKHPTAWVEFEKGLINETELTKKFFKDGRHFDLEELKDCMRKGYCYIDGIEPLLHSLKQNSYEMHAFTNYPTWYLMIEEKLKLSDYLSWTFCSCTIGKRKPEADSYNEVLHHLGVDPSSCVFIDDSLSGLQMWRRLGMQEWWVYISKTRIPSKSGYHLWESARVVRPTEPQETMSQ